MVSESNGLVSFPVRLFSAARPDHIMAMPKVDKTKKQLPDLVKK